MTQAANSKIAKVGLALSVAAALMAAPVAASAQSALTKCAAPGGKQEAGAVVGAVLGGVLGSRVSNNERAGGAVIGAGVGAAAGSAIGCRMQTNDDQRRGVYTAGGQRLASYVQPARFQKAGGRMYATANVNLRSGPSAGSAKVGSLARGEDFQALAWANGGQWVLVGRNGVGVGYVRSDFVRGPQRVASGYGY